MPKVQFFNTQAEQSDIKKRTYASKETQVRSNQNSLTFFITSAEHKQTPEITQSFPAETFLEFYQNTEYLTRIRRPALHGFRSLFRGHNT